MTSTPVEELAETFVEIADAAAGGRGPDDLLDLLAVRCVRLLDVSAAALLLVDHGDQARSTGGSGDRERGLALLEDGPGQDCYQAGEPVVVPDLARTSLRWPEFTATATAAGYASTHTVPMRLRAEVIGALTLFRAVPGVLDKVTDRIAQALADLATIGLLQVRALRQQEGVAEQLQHALNSRVIIEQAKGVTSERLALDMDAAFNALRAYARSNNLRITELSAAVVDGSFDTSLLIRQAD